jgi:2-iminobutanoate/2-iminopropanoate deaminase
MESNVVNPVSGIYRATEDYVHAIEVKNASRLLFVAGTMGLDADGMAPPSLNQQLALISPPVRIRVGLSHSRPDSLIAQPHPGYYYVCRLSVPNCEDMTAPWPAG